MWRDWIVGAALCFIGVLPLAVARAELWRLRTADDRSGSSTWVALLGIALAQFIAIAALTVEAYGRSRAVAFEVAGVAACVAFLEWRKRSAALSAITAPHMIGLGLAAGLAAILIAT
jgi:hypothetical protein